MALTYNKKLAEGFPYIPEAQVADKKPFTITIQPIDSVRQVTLEDGLLKRGKDDTLSISTGSYNISLCRNAIINWENMVGEDGKEIKIELDSTGYISEKSLRQLPTSYINEIADVILMTSKDAANIQLYSAESTK